MAVPKAIDMQQFCCFHPQIYFLFHHFQLILICILVPKMHFSQR